MSLPSSGPGPAPRPAGAARWPLVLLGSSLALVALALAVAAFSARKHTRTTEQLLRDYAAFAAWSYAQRIAEELGEGAWFTLNPIQHSAPHRWRDMPAAADLIAYRAGNLDRCRCPGGVAPASYFRFRLGDDSLQVAGPPLAAGVRPRLVARLTAALRTPERRPPPSGYVAWAPGELGAYGIMPTEWGDTMVYGFTVDSAALAVTLSRVLREAPLLPSAVTRGASNAELLALEVADTGGRVLYRDAGWPTRAGEWPYFAAESLPRFRGGLVARLTIRPAAATTLLSGGFPWSPLPALVVVGLLGLASAALAIVQLRREGQVARLRSDFVAAVSHELRTPLAQLRLFLDTLRLKRYDTPAEQEWLVSHLSRETTRLEHLVENVLALTRLERHAGAELRRERLDPAREVAETLDAFRPLAASRRVEIQAELAAGLTVLGERGAFRQVLLNLLDNAVKFGPAGQTVRVRLARHDGVAELSVADEGPGIAPADRERVWEPYFRGSGARLGATGGSGIGLAIVADLSRRLGGTVRLATATSGGALVTLALPLADQPGPAA